MNGISPAWSTLSLVRKKQSITPRSEIQQKIAEIASLNGSSYSEVVGPSHMAPIVKARHLAMREVKRLYPSMTHKKIAKLFNKDYTVVTYALKKDMERQLHVQTKRGCHD